MSNNINWFTETEDDQNIVTVQKKARRSQRKAAIQKAKNLDTGEAINVDDLRAAIERRNTLK